MDVTNQIIDDRIEEDKFHPYNMEFQDLFDTLFFLLYDIVVFEEQMDGLFEKKADYLRFVKESTKKLIRLDIDRIDDIQHLTPDQLYSINNYLDKLAMEADDLKPLSFYGKLTDAQMMRNVILGNLSSNEIMGGKIQESFDYIRIKEEYNGYSKQIFSNFQKKLKEYDDKHNGGTMNVSQQYGYYKENGVFVFTVNLDMFCSAVRKLHGTVIPGNKDNYPTAYSAQKYFENCKMLELHDKEWSTVKRKLEDLNNGRKQEKDCPEFVDFLRKLLIAQDNS